MSKCEYCGSTASEGYSGAFHDLLCAKRQEAGSNLNFFMDGDMWCATYKDFKNLQESPAGFGSTKASAQYSLTKELIL